MHDPVERAHQEFANAIVKQAAEDYRRALRGKTYNSRSPKRIIEEIEEFFRSRYFKILTPINGEYLIEYLKKEYEKERNEHGSNTDTIDT